MVTLTGAFLTDLLKLEASEQTRTIEALAQLTSEERISSLRTRKMQGVPFWEIRASQELRIIANKSTNRFVCQIVDHHDAAFRRASRATPIIDEEPFAQTSIPRISDTNADNARFPLAAMSDNQLANLFEVDGSWCDAVRSFRDSDAAINSGIETVIGTSNLSHLIDFIDEQLIVPGKHARILEGNLLRDALKESIKWDKVDHLVIVAPRLEKWDEQPTFGYLLEKLREYKIRTTVITRSPIDEKHFKAINAFDSIRTCELLLNNTIYAYVFAALGPPASSFAAIGAATDDANIQATGVYFGAGRGHDRIIRSFANVGLHTLRTALETSVFKDNTLKSA